MHRLVSQDQVPLTRELCEEWRSMPTWKVDRPLKSQRVAYLDKKLRDGAFHTPLWTKAIYMGKEYRINGQHSSYALCEANGYFPAGLKATIETFVCESPEDMADLFCQYDDPRSGRSGREIINAFASIYDDLADVPRAVIQTCVAGVAAAKTECGIQYRLDREDKARLVRSHIEFIRWVALNDLLRSTYLRRAAVVAAMYKTWQRDAAEAERFWTAVRDGTDPTKTPTRVLQDFLRDNQTKRSANNSATGCFPDRAFLVKSLHAWNAWRRGVGTDLKYHSKSPVPATL